MKEREDPVSINIRKFLYFIKGSLGLIEFIAIRSFLRVAPRENPSI